MWLSGSDVFTQRFWGLAATACDVLVGLGVGGLLAVLWVLARSRRAFDWGFGLGLVVLGASVGGLGAWLRTIVAVFQKPESYPADLEDISRAEELLPRVEGVALGVGLVLVVLVVIGTSVARRGRGVAAGVAFGLTLQVAALLVVAVTLELSLRSFAVDMTRERARLEALTSASERAKQVWLARTPTLRAEELRAGAQAVPGLRDTFTAWVKRADARHAMPERCFVTPHGDWCGEGAFERLVRVQQLGSKPEQLRDRELILLVTQVVDFAFDEPEPLWADLVTRPRVVRQAGRRVELWQSGRPVVALCSPYSVRKIAVTLREDDTVVRELGAWSEKRAPCPSLPLDAD